MNRRICLPWDEFKVDYDESLKSDIEYGISRQNPSDSQIAVDYVVNQSVEVIWSVDIVDERIVMTSVHAGLFIGRLESAQAKARRARFEFGEKG